MDENGWLVEDRRGITWARGTLLARERRALVQQRGLQHLHAARGGDVPVTILPEVPLHSRQPPWRHRISPWGRVRSSAAVPEVAGRCCGASRGNRPARRPVPGYATVPPPSPFSLAGASVSCRGALALQHDRGLTPADGGRSSAGAGRANRRLGLRLALLRVGDDGAHGRGCQSGRVGKSLVPLS